MNIDFDKVREQASGRWVSIYRALGIDIDETGKHGKCPNCQGSDRMRVDRDVAERGSYYCGQCGPGDGFSLIMKVMGVDIKEAMESVSSVVGACEVNATPKENTMTPELMRKIFTSSFKISQNDHAWKYLTCRGLSKIPEILRYHPACWESETKKNQKAMLAVFTGHENKALTMHRTFLDQDSNKLNIKSPKKILPSLEKMNGGAVRLFPQNGDVLGIAEGIETSIAASQDLGIPVWSALTSTLLESFKPPREVKTLMVISDNDANYSGQKAAYSLANKAVISYKINANVYVPEKTNTDWLDILNGRNAQEREKLIC